MLSDECELVSVEPDHQAIMRHKGAAIGKCNIALQFEIISII